MLARTLKAQALVVCLVGAACLAGCGGGGQESYSASRFTECLQARDASPTDLAEGDANDQASIRDQLAREARQQNGAVRAFTNTKDPNASSISLLFFRGANEARRAARRVEDDIKTEAKRQREKGLEPGRVPAPEVRSNVVILDHPTEAQSRVLDECLDQSSG